MLDLITSTEAARIAGIQPSTFRQLLVRAKSPVPPPVVHGGLGRTNLWHRADIEEWAASRDRKRGRRKD